jgi:DNA polymerase III epsilon subunit-like protein
MKPRQLVLDTETTGLDPKAGDRIVAIAFIDRTSGENYHVYINPERDSHPGALKVHGLTTEFLADKPKFINIADTLLKAIEGAELIIHNAAFDIGFLNHELALLGKEPLKNKVIDTLPLAIALVPAEIITTELVRKQLLDDEKVVQEQKALVNSTESLIAELLKNPKFRAHSLDHLCKYFGISLATREKHHGALIDCQLLTQVYSCLQQEQLKQEQKKSASIVTVSLFKHEAQESKDSNIILELKSIATP